jgi:hypothetical protein
MGSAYFSLFDMAICGVPALTFAGWQLVSVNREIRRDKQARSDSPERSGHPVREHRLDDR